MKKILSITMALSMLISVLCCVPARANVYAGYPGLSLGFEENNLAELNISGLSATWKAEGVNGSKGCMNLTDKTSWGNPNIYLSKPLEIGRTYRLGMWVRVNLDSFEGKTATMSTILYTTSAVSGKSAYKFLTLSGTIQPNTWSYMSTEFVWNGKATDEGASGAQNDINPDAQVRACPRLTCSSSTLYMVLSGTDKYKDDPSFAVNYDLDDIILEPVPGERSEAVYDESFVLAKDFEDGKTTGLTGLSDVIEDADPERGKVGYINTPTGSFTAATAPGVIQANHLYKISCWIKRLDDYCVYNGTTTTVACIANPANRQDFVNIAPNSKWPTATSTAKISEQNKWYYYEWYIKYEAKTFDNFTPDTGIRIGNSAASKAVGQSGEIGLEGVEWCIDDYMIQDLGPIVQNGDFEHEAAPIFRVHATGQGTTTDSVFAWKAENAATAVSTDVREDADTESTQSMEVSITADGGHVYQGMELENGKTYTFSFWAKGKDLADGETKPISITLDRKVDTVHEKDVYDVPDYETIGNEWLLTNQWERYEFDFTYSYDYTSTPASGVVPRMPLLYFDVDGNKAGTSFLLDDFEIVDVEYVEPDTRYPYAYAELIEVDASDGFVDGAEVVIKYGYTSEMDNMEGDTVARIMMSEDGVNWGILDHVIANGDVRYTIPEFAIGKQLKAEILPVEIVDNAYRIGDLLSVDLGTVGKAVSIIPEITKWDEGSEVAAQVYFETNKLSLGDQNVVAILAVYDENNTLVGMSNTPSVVSVGTPETIRVSASLAGAEGLTPAYARLFVWSGTSLADAGETIYTDAVLYPEAE